MTLTNSSFHKIFTGAAVFFVTLIVMSIIGFSYSQMTRPPVDEDLLHPQKNGLVLGEYDER